MHCIVGLIDPRDMRVFHVGCAPKPPNQIDNLPAAVSARVAEMQPSTPQVVVLQTVDAHPQIEWVKWSKRFRRDIVTSDWHRYESIAMAFTNSNRTKRLLGEEVPSDAIRHAKFHEYDREHPEVFEEMLRRARELLAEGRDSSGVDKLAIEIRYEGPNAADDDGYKFNNDFQPFYARKLLMVDASLCRLFVVRESIADDLVLDDGRTRTWRDFAHEHSDSLRFAGPEGTEEEDVQWAY